MKMNELFEFLFDEDTLNNTLKNIWITVYDPTYVEEKIIGGLLKTANDVEDLLDFLYEKARNTLNDEENEKKKQDDKNENKENKENEEEEEEEEEKEVKDLSKIGKTLSQLKREKKRTTRLNLAKKTKKELIIQPFNLSENKPRKFKEPNELETKFEMKPLPLGDYNKTSLADIENKRKERLEIIKKNVLEKYNVKQFEFASDKRPSNKEKIKEEIEKKIESTLQFNNKYVNPPIDYSKFNGDVKYNEAGILREEFNINKNKKNEENELKRKLIEKTDSSEYERFLSENRERDDILNMQKIQKRRIELGLARDAAVNYKIRKTLENQIKVAEHKRQEELNLKHRNEKKKREISKKRELVLEIGKEHENINKNRIKREIENKENYQNFRNEFNKLTLIAKEEQKILNDRRDDLIRQIRELEKIPVKRVTGYDPSETPGYGLLEEMSIIELKERLEIQKKMHLDEINSKREENKLKMSEKNDEILQKANFIMNYRDKMRNEREIKRQKKLDDMKNQENLKRQIHEFNAFEARKNLENKREKLRKEDEIFMKKLHEINLQRQFLKQGRSAVEEKIYHMMEDGMERKVTNRQNQDLIDQQKKESINWKDINLRYNQSLNSVINQKNLLSNYRNGYEISKSLNEKAFLEDRNFKQQVHDREFAIGQYQKLLAKERSKFSDMLESNKKKKNVNKNLNNEKNKDLSYVDNSNLNVIDENDEVNPIVDKLENENKNNEGNEEKKEQVLG